VAEGTLSIVFNSSRLSQRSLHEKSAEFFGVFSCVIANGLIFCLKTLSLYLSLILHFLFNAVPTCSNLPSTIPSIIFLLGSEQDCVAALPILILSPIFPSTFPSIFSFLLVACYPSTSSSRFICSRMPARVLCLRPCFSLQIYTPCFPPGCCRVPGAKESEQGQTRPPSSIYPFPFPPVFHGMLKCKGRLPLQVQVQGHTAVSLRRGGSRNGVPSGPHTRRESEHVRACVPTIDVRPASVKLPHRVGSLRGFLRAERARRQMLAMKMSKWKLQFARSSCMRQSARMRQKSSVGLPSRCYGDRRSENLRCTRSI
jgi:hypothetical protein